MLKQPNFLCLFFLIYLLHQSPPQLPSLFFQVKLLTKITDRKKSAAMEEIVVESLLSGNRESQIEAAIELTNLSRKQRQKLAEREIISPLLSMLQSQDCITTEVALSALLSLAFGSERFVFLSVFNYSCAVVTGKIIIIVFITELTGTKSEL